MSELTKDDLADAVSKAMRKAYQLGQTYWQQADSESHAANKRSEVTQQSFDDLVMQTRAQVWSRLESWSHLDAGVKALSGSKPTGAGSAPALEPVRTPDILTSTGDYFKFLEPHDSRFDIETIAHALSHICRFTGHTRVFYSVAQHSVLVSYLVQPEHQLAALLHDAAEAFLGDVSKPLKGLLPDYAELERNIEPAVFSRFSLPEKLHPSIKRADLVMLLTEARDLMPEHNNAEWAARMGAEPSPEPIEPWTSERAKTEFLQRYTDLTALPEWQLS